MPPKPRRKKHHNRIKHKSSKNDIRRIQVANVSAPQLAVVRPRTKRTVSGSSGSGAQNMDIAQIVPASKNKSTPNLQHRSPPVGYPTPPHSPRSPPHYYTIHEAQTHAPAHAYLPPPTVDPLPHLPYHRRRADKLTPSMYTFASDSTKLGEIPMNRWPQPFDFEEMQRKNAEAATRPMPMPVGKPSRGGLFGLFRKKANLPVSIPVPVGGS
jgi:hypothetical protein